jgi:hypothetical protein
VFNIHFVSSRHRYKVILIFLVVELGVLSISTARGRPRREVDSATMVFLSVFQQHFPSFLCRFDAISGFLLAKIGGMPISAARGTGNDVTIRFLDPDLVWFAVGIFRLSVTVQKLFEFSSTTENVL